MKRFAFGCLFCSVLLLVAGCNDTASKPSAQSPATDSADQQEVMKPAMPAETTPAATGEEKEELPAADAASDDAAAADASPNDASAADVAADDAAAAADPETEPAKP